MSSAPTPYDRQSDFTSFQAPDAPTVGQDLEAEFNKIDQALDETQARLAEIQRDDGEVRNSTIGLDQLKPEVIAQFGSESSVAAHVAEPNPHPQYASSTVVNIKISAAILDHEGKFDPHPQYMTQSEADARYALLAHTHALSALTQSGASVGQVPTWNGSAWVPDTVSGGGGGATNLTFSRDGTTVTVISDTGTDAALPAATGSLAGVLTAADKTKLDGIQSGAQVNPANTTAVPEGTNLYYTDARARTACVAQTITNGVTSSAPSQDAVHDALALKADLSGPAFTDGPTVDGIEIGYRGVPLTTQNTAYTLVEDDAGKGIEHNDTTPRSYTINGSVFARGTVITVLNNTGTGAVTIVQGTGMTLRLAGSTSTGNRTVAVRGMATIYFASATEAYVSGPGVT